MSVAMVERPYKTGIPLKKERELAEKIAFAPSADSRILELMRRSRHAPVFICAPHKTGRTSLALDFAGSYYDLDEVLWINASCDGFVEALCKQTMLEHLQRQIARGLSRYKLIVIDDLPSLKEREASRFSSWIDQMIELDVGVIVVTTPQEDSLKCLQSDRLVIEGERFILSQKWNSVRITSSIKAFFDSSIPIEIKTLAALMILMGHGAVDNLTDLGYQVPFNNHSILKRHCPLIEIEETTGYFNARGINAQELSRQLIELLNRAPRTCLDPEMSDLERCFERLTQMSVYLFERSQREQSQALLELAGDLLTCDDTGFLLSETDASAASGCSDNATNTRQNNKKANQIIVLHEQENSGEELQMIDTELYEDEPEQLMVRLFGDFKVMKGGRHIDGKPMQRSKVRALLIHLALNMGKGLSRDLLLERIWPEKDYCHAKDNFYSTWSMLNSLLSEERKDSPYMSNRQGLCRLEQRYVFTDVYEFECLSKAVLFQQGTVEDRIDAIYRIEQLYRGDIMSGTKVDSYVQAAQDRYRSILVDVMIEASRIFSQQGNGTNAVWFARKAFDTDPTREDVYRTLMSMQDKAGQRTSALRTYFDCKRFLSEELGILPSQQTIALYQELVMDGR